jgi:hypothetical protein
MQQIDKNIIYTANQYQYKSFALLSPKERQDILNWRNHEAIRLMMYNSDIITLDEHLSFINSLDNRDDRYYWLAFKESTPYGIVYIADITGDGSAEVGLYRNPQISDNAGGLDLYWNFYNFLFFQLDFCSLVAGMDIRNKVAILLNSFLGFKYAHTKNINDRQFLMAICSKEDIKNDWYNKNNLREMLKYYQSDTFKNFGN